MKDLKSLFKECPAVKFAGNKADSQKKGRSWSIRAGLPWLLISMTCLTSCDQSVSESGSEDRVSGEKGTKARMPEELLTPLLTEKLGATTVTVVYADQNQVILNCQQPGEPANRVWNLSFAGYQIPQGGSEVVENLGQSATWANERDIGLVVRLDDTRSFCLVTYRSDSMNDVIAAHKDEARGGRWKKEAIEIGRELAQQLE